MKPEILRSEIETLLRAGPHRHAETSKPMSDVAKWLVLYAPTNSDEGKVVVEVLDSAKIHGPDRPDVAKEIRNAFALLRSQVQAARDWETGLDDNLLDAFPAVEVSVVIRDREPPDWHARWQKAGGKNSDGRCVALKKSGVLERFNAYGHPFPPFHWGDALYVQDLDRGEAEDLGLIR